MAGKKKKKKRTSSPLEDDQSKVEPRPKGSRKEVKRKIGRLDEEESVSLTAPSPLKKGRKTVPRAAVGLRAATEPAQGSTKTSQAQDTARKKVREARDRHRQKVWDKLDEARRKADEKRPRFAKFQSRRDDQD